MTFYLHCDDGKLEVAPAVAEPVLFLQPGQPTAWVAQEPQTSDSLSNAGAFCAGAAVAVGAVALAAQMKSTGRVATLGAGGNVRAFGRTACSSLTSIVFLLVRMCYSNTKSPGVGRNTQRNTQLFFENCAVEQSG